VADFASTEYGDTFQEARGVLDARTSAGYFPGAPAAAEADPPVITYVTTPGALSERNAPISVTVSDVSSLSAVVMFARFSSGYAETVYAGGSFEAPYLGSSVVAGGQGPEFTIRRGSPWPSSFDLVVLAVDEHGNAEAST